MALPKVLKNMILFVDGVSLPGKIGSVTLPKLTRKLEEWRGGGMIGAVKQDMGQEPIDLEYSAGGILVETLKQYGAVAADALQHRWVGAYQDDATGKYTAVEIVTRGRHEEIDMGDAKPGEGGEQKMKVSCAYYKLTVDGRDIIEIDFMPGGAFIVDGVDRNAEVRNILGI